MFNKRAKFPFLSSLPFSTQIQIGGEGIIELINVAAGEDSSLLLESPESPSSPPEKTSSGEITMSLSPQASPLKDSLSSSAGASTPTTPLSPLRRMNRITTGRSHHSFPKEKRAYQKNQPRLLVLFSFSSTVMAAAPDVVPVLCVPKDSPLQEEEEEREFSFYIQFKVC